MIALVVAPQRRHLHDTFMDYSEMWHVTWDLECLHP